MAGPVTATSVGVFVLLGGKFVAVASARTVGGGSVAVAVSVAGAAQPATIMTTNKTKPEATRCRFMKSSWLRKSPYALCDYREFQGKIKDVMREWSSAISIKIKQIG